MYAPTRTLYRPRGIGDATSTARGVTMASGMATPVLTGVLAAHAAATAAATGAPAVILGMSPALAVPIIGAALVGVTIAAVYLIKNSGCGPTCVQSSEWANQAEPLLRQNIAAYFASPRRSISQRNTAVSNFEVIVAQLQKLCSQPEVGNAGKACIADRQSGACKWHATADSPWPGGPKQGECWNWFNAYRDPIANDRDVVDDSLMGSASAVFGGASDSGLLIPLLVIGGLVALGVTAS